MSQIFVLDTNVLLFDANSIFKFGENDVLISLVVIEELDRFKRDQNENGRNARQFSRIVDDLRKLGSLSQGVKLESGGKLIITIDLDSQYSNNDILDLSIKDNLILNTAYALKDKGETVTLVTKDINLRLKADIIGVNSEDYGKRDTTLEELYTGRITLEVSPEELRSFETDKFLKIDKLKEKGIFSNQYIVVQETNNDRRKSYGRYNKEKGGVIPLIHVREGVWGIYPKNVEQRFALDALLNDDIKLVSLVGKAGTGKTLLALAAGLEMTIAQEKYTRLLVSRPIQPMGNDLGYLPGDVEEKLAPWMQPIFDNMDFLFGRKKGEHTSSYEDLINEGLLHVEALTYIRGRTIPGQYLIVDEAQNLSPHEVKTIITRAGENTKIVLTGDCAQIDSPYLDSVNNGLAYCVERLKGADLVGHTTLTVGERSALSEIASELL